MNTLSTSFSRCGLRTWADSAFGLARRSTLAHLARIDGGGEGLQRRLGSDVERATHAKEWSGGGGGT